MYDELVKRLRMRANLFKQINQMENCIMDEAADAIEKLSKPKWIPVTERLPEDDVPVLACYVGYRSHLLRSDLLACRYEDEWCHWDGEPCSHEKCKVIITHWMPLPELPREET